MNQVEGYLFSCFFVRLDKEVVAIPGGLVKAFPILRGCDCSEIVAMAHVKDVYLPSGAVAARVGVGQDEDPWQSREFMTFGGDAKGVFDAARTVEAPFLELEHVGRVMESRSIGQCFVA